MKSNDAIAQFILASIASITILLLASVFIFLFTTGFHTFEYVPVNEFLLGINWNPDSYGHPSWGIVSLLTSTLMVSMLSLVVAVPFGLSAAIYLAEIASPKHREFLKPLIEMLASIPSVVLGLLGLLFLAPIIARLFHISSGLNVLTASLLVAITAIPTIASLCEDSISNISDRFREASFSLGASKWTTIKKITIPAAKSGIIAAIMLGLGRIIGETMIVLMVAGNSRALPTSILDPVRPITANIAIEIREVVIGSLHWQSLFAMGLILFTVTFIINLLVDILIRKQTVR